MQLPLTHREAITISIDTGFTTLRYIQAVQPDVEAATAPQLLNKLLSYTRRYYFFSLRSCSLTKRCLRHEVA